MNSTIRLLLEILSFLLLSFTVHAQVKLSGVVNDQDGNPLPGANVVLVETYLVDVSGIDGTFEFNNLSRHEYQLKISYIGYENKELSFALANDTSIVVTLEFSPVTTQEFTVIGTRADRKMPIVFSTVSNLQIKSENVGQDMPALLSQSPSVTYHSDAGAGVGYTYMRLRGADQTSINVTVNGIPANDAESQQVFWVDMPDLASSTENIQIQRGVGTSTNGVGAFGGAVNLLTDDMKTEAYGSINLAAGSFNTFKGTLKIGSGIIDNHWAFNGRLSYITSDGYMDRSGANLLSYYTSVGYTSAKTTFRLILFGGKEITNQAWNGVPSVRLENDEQGMLDYAAASGWGPVHTENLLNSDRRYNYYTWKDEVDNYSQFNNQLLFTRELNRFFALNVSLHYTKGNGYFEQYQYAENAFDDNQFEFYGLDNPVIGNDTITTSDFIRRRWLDNDFYGFVASLNYKKSHWNVWLGGGWNKYDGQHFGEVIWSTIATTYTLPYRYYDNSAIKNDGNVYARANYQINNKLNLYIDLQYRRVNYSFDGVDANGSLSQQDVKLNFFNPKAGFNYQIDPKNRLFISFGVGHKEPNRDDYIISTPDSRPKAQTLFDTEFGYDFRIENFAFNFVFYNMKYDNQLIQTGALNSVGEEIRTNVKDSYRRGIELMFTWRPANWFEWNLNTTLSQNKIKNHTEYIDNWNTWSKDTLQLGTTDLVFSPAIIGGSQLTFTVFQSKANKKGKENSLFISLISKYVGKQFIDNTSSDKRSIAPYFVNDIRLNFNMQNVGFKNLEIIALVRNVFDVNYVSSAWVYKYNLEGSTKVLDGLFPQAGINFMLGVNFGF